MTRALSVVTASILFGGAEPEPCVEGRRENAEDRAADGMMCHQDMGHCRSTTTGM